MLAGRCDMDTFWPLIAHKKHLPELTHDPDLLLFTPIYANTASDSTTGKVYMDATLFWQR